MKHLAFSLMLFFLIAAPSSASAADAKPDPSQYTIAVHVSASKYAPPVDRGEEVLTVTIDGKHYKILGGTRGHGLIAPGDYHARLSNDERKTPYESERSFEFLFPDGSTRRFDVIAQSE